MFMLLYWCSLLYSCIIEVLLVKSWLDSVFRLLFGCGIVLIVFVWLIVLLRLLLLCCFSCLCEIIVRLVGVCSMFRFNVELVLVVEDSLLLWVLIICMVFSVVGGVVLVVMVEVECRISVYMIGSVVWCKCVGLGFVFIFLWYVRLFCNGRVVIRNG